MGHAALGHPVGRGIASARLLPTRAERLPDTLKAKGFDAVRAELAADAVSLAADGGSMHNYDFKAALTERKAQDNNRWRHLLEQEGAPALSRARVGDCINIPGPGACTLHSPGA